MRVNDSHLNGANGLQPSHTTETQEAGRVGSNSGAQVSESAGGDRTEISSLTGRISQTLAAHTAERSQRIEKLAKDYSAGRYQANSRSTSGAIVRDAIERKDGAR